MNHPMVMLPPEPAVAWPDLAMPQLRPRAQLRELLTSASPPLLEISPASTLLYVPFVANSISLPFPPLALPLSSPALRTAEPSLAA